MIYAVKHISMAVNVRGNFWLYYALQSCVTLLFVLLFCSGFLLLLASVVAWTGFGLRNCGDWAEARIAQLKTNRRVSSDAQQQTW
ncbi:MAG TPA: hypothetical protein VF133_07080 [Terriglobales bacterium]|nr:hypothetical protein [Terriglobales bacterium]